MSQAGCTNVTPLLGASLTHLSPSLTSVFLFLSFFFFFSRDLETILYDICKFIVLSFPFKV